MPREISTQIERERERERERKSIVHKKVYKKYIYISSLNTPAQGGKGKGGGSGVWVGQSLERWMVWCGLGGAG